MVCMFVNKVYPTGGTLVAAGRTFTRPNDSDSLL